MIVITVARKPLGCPVVDNITKWGTGGLNIDESRVEGPSGAGVWGTSNATVRGTRMFNDSPGMRDWKSKPHSKGRFPLNVIFEHKPECSTNCWDGCPIQYLNQCVGVKKSGTMKKWYCPNESRSVYGGPSGRWKQSTGDEGFVSRFFKQVKL